MYSSGRNYCYSQRCFFAAASFVFSLRCKIHGKKLLRKVLAKTHIFSGAATGEYKNAVVKGLGTIFQRFQMRNVNICVPACDGNIANNWASVSSAGASRLRAAGAASISKAKSWFWLHFCVLLAS